MKNWLSRFWRSAPAPSAPIRTASLVDLAGARGWSVEELFPGRSQFRQPSRTLPEEVERMESHYEEWVQNHDVTRNSRERRWAEQYYQELYHVSEKRFAPIFRAELTSVQVEALHGCIRTEDGLLLTDSSLVDARISSPAFSGNHAVPLIAEGFSLLGSWPGNYAHWLMDTLPKLAAVDFSVEGLPLLILPEPKAFHVDSLAVLGFPADRLLPLPAACVKVERLRMVRAASRTGYPRQELITALRDRFRRAAPLGTPGRKIYVSRAGSTRRVLNEAEILPILQSNGFEVVRCEELSFREQLDLFSEAEVIAGPHGAGVYNFLFAKPGARVIEFYNPLRWDSAAARIASLLDFEHWHLYGENVGDSFDMTVSPARLEKLLQAVEEGAQTHG